MDKAELRKLYKTKRMNLSSHDCESYKAALTKHLLGLPALQEAKKIMAYLAMPKEADLDDVIKALLASGKEVYVPVCISKTEMIAARLHSMDDVVRGVLHIRIPKEPYETIQPEDLDVILVPGVAFDRAGGRLGMGAGYYDRFLTRTKAKLVATAWQIQLSDEPVPMADYDKRVQMIVTDEDIIEVKES